MDGLMLSGFLRPFNGKKLINKIRTYGQYRGRSGVYLIKEDDTVVYVGMSKSCVVEAAYRHFYKWSDSKTHKRVTYLKNVTRYTLCIFLFSSDQSVQVEAALIRALQPRDNTERYVEDTPDFSISDVTF